MEDPWVQFEAIRKGRWSDAAEELSRHRKLVVASLVRLRSFKAEPIEWRGPGDKWMSVFQPESSTGGFSRPVNEGLFLSDPDQFSERWDAFVTALSAAPAALPAIDAEAAAYSNTVLYTSAIAFAALNDLERSGNRGSPGTFFEILIGSTLALLLGVPVEGSIRVSLPGSSNAEKVPVDLSFPPNAIGRSLVVPTKLTTRERISQAFVHQRILDVAGEESGVVYKTALVVCSENNVLFQKGKSKRESSPSDGWVVDTLVPGTITLYHRFVSRMDRIYYLDPPSKYLELSVNSAPEDFPYLAPISEMYSAGIRELLVDNYSSPC